MIFADRRDAGRRLAEALGAYRSLSPAVLALPRGGVSVAEPVAEALDAPLDLVFVRKLGAPGHPELAVGAVAERRERAEVLNPSIVSALALDERLLAAAAEREFREIARRRRLYLGGAEQEPLKDRVVIVIDDGVATGATTRAALRAVRAERPRKLVLAVPVAPASGAAELEDEADEVVCLEQPEPFYAVGAFYDDFSQVSDEEVAAALARRRRPPAA